MAINPLEWLKVARAIDRLLALETKHAALIEAQAKEIQTLKDRVTALEAREAVLLADARGAAAAAASAVAAQHVSDVSRRLGVLEERSRSVDRLPPFGTDQAMLLSGSLLLSQPCSDDRNARPPRLPPRHRR